jgi:hypothetical protein
MFYCTYKGRTIDILKCARCRSYSLELKPADQADSNPDWIRYSFTCLACQATGSVRLASDVPLESFPTWEELMDRVEELKVAMTLMELR